LVGDDETHLIFEDRADGRWAVAGRGSWTKRTTDALRRSQIRNLQLHQARDESGDAVNFLRDLDWIEKLSINDFTLGDDSAVEALCALRQLALGTQARNPLNLKELRKLDYCMLNWRRKTDSLFDCVTLRRLSITAGFKAREVGLLPRLSRLENLALWNVSANSVEPLGSLHKLKSLSLARWRKLESLRGLRSLVNLEELEIESCRGCQSLEDLRPLVRLKKLFLNNVGKVESLASLEGMRDLEWFLFIESTNIMDGDLSVLKRLPNLKRTGFMERSHYTHSRGDLPE
jgi:hypothetical protein